MQNAPKDNSLSAMLRRRVAAFGYAFEGIAYLLKTQPNGRFHLFATVVVTVLGLWAGLSRWEWVMLVGVITAVIAAELFNTAIESIVDMVMPDQHPLAKAAKDTAAGAVLITAIGALIVGLLILGPPILNKF